ncbi:hypothetical protein DZJ_25410 [Dickeya ananatis]
MNNFNHSVFRRALGLMAVCALSYHVQAQADDPLLINPAHPTQMAASSDNQARGILVAVDQATISSDLAGRIVEMPFREGESFKKRRPAGAF